MQQLEFRIPIHSYKLTDETRERPRCAKRPVVRTRLAASAGFFWPPPSGFRGKAMPVRKFHTPRFRVAAQVATWYACLFVRVIHGFRLQALAEHGNQP